MPCTNGSDGSGIAWRALERGPGWRRVDWLPRPRGRRRQYRPRSNPGNRGLCEANALMEAARSPARHLLHVFPSFAIGGAQVRLALVADRLGSKYRHTIIALNGVYDCRSRL